MFTGCSSRVHFSEDVAETHNDEITLEYVSQDRVDIHLGYLKLDHRYRITFTVKDNLGDKITADKNENISIHESVPNAEGIYWHISGVQCAKENFLMYNITAWNVNLDFKINVILRFFKVIVA